MTGNVGNNTGKGLPPGQLPLNAEEGSGGTGAHAILVDGDYLIYACPPARQIFWVNKKSWKVKSTWPVPGNRTHGMGWGKDRKTIWSSDSNLNAFFHHDAATGEHFREDAAARRLAGDPRRQAGGRHHVFLRRYGLDLPVSKFKHGCLSKWLSHCGRGRFL